MAQILIAEPYPEVRDLLVRIMHRLGHNPVCANGSRPDAAEFDLLLLEPSFPGGAELARELREGRPDLPIVCVSIYPPSDEVAALEPAAYLQKPFGLAQLEDAVTAAIQRVAAKA